MTTDFKIKEFNIKIPEESCSWIVLGPPGSGKSSFVEDLIRYNMERFPVARINTNIPKGYERFLKIFPPIFVFNNFNIKQEQEFVNKRQKPMSISKNRAKHCIYLLDDIENAEEAFKSSFFDELFKRGTRHYNLLTIVVSQYAMTLAPPLRSASSYIAIFKFTSEADRKKLYNNFGGTTIFGNEKKFYECLDLLTGDYSCMIIKQGTASNDPKDCVFYYKAEPKNNWKFNPEFKALWKWDEDRCDKKRANRYFESDNQIEKPIYSRRQG